MKLYLKAQTLGFLLMWGAIPGYTGPIADAADWQSVYEASGLNPSAPLNQLDTKEKAVGWELLFDGETISDSWRGFKQDSLPPSWYIDDSAILRHHSGGGTILFDEQYENFVWALEWKIERGGNSGIFIRGDESQSTFFWSAIEMQVLDNLNNTNAYVPVHMAGGAYDLYSPVKGEDNEFDATFSQDGNPDGYNKVLIIASGPNIEFWLNGYKVVEFEIGSDDWNRRFSNSKFKRYENFGTLPSGYIGLQDHTNKVWYRNLKIRKLPENATQADIWPGLESISTYIIQEKKTETRNRWREMPFLRIDGKRVGHSYWSQKFRPQMITPE